MARRYAFALAVVLCAAALLAALGNAASGARPDSPATVSTPAPWPMFHLDSQHIGVQTGTGNIITSTGPVVRWRFRVSDPAPVAAQTDLDNVYYRWTSTMPLADLDGDGTLEIVVTTPDGTSEPDRIIALKDDPVHTPPVRALWVYTSPFTYAFTDTRKGFDTYSPVLADADGDGLPDVIFTTKDGWIRALKGTTGHELWAFNLERRTEDGPMLVDLYGDGMRQIVITTDCGDLNSTFCPDQRCRQSCTSCRSRPRGPSRRCGSCRIRTRWTRPSRLSPRSTRTIPRARPLCSAHGAANCWLPGRPAAAPSSAARCR